MSKRLDKGLWEQSAWPVPNFREVWCKGNFPELRRIMKLSNEELEKGFLDAVDEANKRGEKDTYWSKPVNFYRFEMAERMKEGRVTFDGPDEMEQPQMKAGHVQRIERIREEIQKLKAEDSTLFVTEVKTHHSWVQGRDVRREERRCTNVARHREIVLRLKTLNELLKKEIITDTLSKLGDPAPEPSLSNITAGGKVILNSPAQVRASVPRGKHGKTKRVRRSAGQLEELVPKVLDRIDELRESNTFSDACNIAAETSEEDFGERMSAEAIRGIYQRNKIRKGHRRKKR
jgi:hypothetical protein